MKLKSHTFKAKIYSVGINRCVDIPERVTLALGQEKYVPIIGKVEKLPIRSNLVPRGGGQHRLFIHRDIWRRLRVDNGDSVKVSIQRDFEPRDIIVPDDINSALRANQEAHEAYKAMTDNGRRSFVRWISEAKQAETRGNRILVGLERLIENSRRKKHR
ncbi:MAG: DUF1905 domain-containing protein [candidate division Zixibacteria bacterium]|nr:DUF1905 domain-containing protein [candidate division Zixibacteria bacterium]